MVFPLDSQAAVALSLLALGAALPILFLRCGPRPARGWCRHCNAPDLWVILRHTATSRTCTLAALSFSMSSIGVLVQSWVSGTPPGRIEWIASGVLPLLAAAAAVLARHSRRRSLRCRTCEAEARPRSAA